MTPPHSHQDRAAEAASFADRLRGDIVNLSAQLDRYRGDARLEDLRQRSLMARHRLEALAGRVGGLGRSADPGKYSLSDGEHAVLDDARDVRNRLMQALADFQDLERRTPPLR